MMGGTGSAGSARVGSALPTLSTPTPVRAGAACASAVTAALSGEFGASTPK